MAASSTLSLTGLQIRESKGQPLSGFEAMDVMGTQELATSSPDEVEADGTHPSRPSSVARYLEARQANPQDMEEALEASLAEHIDSVLHAEHVQSERRRPRAHDLTHAMPRTRRAEIVSWMTQAFDVLQMDDAFLHSVTNTLDRYYAVSTTPVDDAVLQHILLAAICTEMKVAGNVDNTRPDHHWKRLVSHLCQGLVPVLQVLRVELELLNRLDFVVGLPTPVSFLRGLAVRLREDGMEHALMGLATFLLELALLNPELEYGYAHSYLAAGALSAAMRVLGASPEHRQELLRDVSICWPQEASKGTRSALELVSDCEQELLGFWVMCSRGIGEFAALSLPLQAKLSRRLGGAAVYCTPDEALRQLHQECEDEHLSLEAQCRGARAPATFSETAALALAVVA